MEVGGYRDKKAELGTVGRTRIRPVKGIHFEVQYRR